MVQFEKNKSGVRIAGHVGGGGGMRVTDPSFSNFLLVGGGGLRAWAGGWIRTAWIEGRMYLPDELLEQGLVLCPPLFLGALFPLARASVRAERGGDHRIGCKKNDER